MKAPPSNSQFPYRERYESIGRWPEHVDGDMKIGRPPFDARLSSWSVALRRSGHPEER